MTGRPSRLIAGSAEVSWTGTGPVFGATWAPVTEKERNAVSLRRDGRRP